MEKNTFVAPYLSLIAKIGGPILFFAGWFGPWPADFPPSAAPVVGLTLWMAVWWLTESAPMAVTALLPLIVLPLTGVSTFSQAAIPFSNEIIMLFLGSFILGSAIERWGLHKRLSLLILSGIGANMRMLLLGFMGVTAFISMWISNTATCAMMLPIGMAMTTQFEGPERERFTKAIVLGIAYAASLGGMGTPIGTPTNGIMLVAYQEFFGRSVGFLEWMMYAMPLMVFLVLLTWAYMTFWTYRLPGKAEGLGVNMLANGRKALGPTSPEEWLTLAVFGGVALCWLCGAWLSKLLPGVNDAMIALAGAILLFLLPAPTRKGQFLMDWPTAERIPWGALLLFGGGLSLAESFRISGFSDYLGKSMAGLQYLPSVLAILVILIAVVALSEVASNVATAAMIVPILATLAGILGEDPFLLMLGATLASSCGFMLPVATGPNALAFSTGHLHVRDMARAGLFLDVMCILGILLLIIIVR